MKIIPLVLVVFIALLSSADVESENARFEIKGWVIDPCVKQMIVLNPIGGITLDQHMDYLMKERDVIDSWIDSIQSVISLYPGDRKHKKETYKEFLASCLDSMKNTITTTKY